MTHRDARRATGKLMVTALVPLTTGCATSGAGSPGLLDGVYAYTAYRGQNSFEGTFSLAPSPDGYQGYLIMRGSDLPLARSSVEGPRVTLVFENSALTVVLTMTRDGNGLRGSWRSINGSGSIRATRVSTAWHQDPLRSRRPGGPGGEHPPATPVMRLLPRLTPGGSSP